MATGSDNIRAFPGVLFLDLFMVGPYSRGRAATCPEGFVIYFKKVPLACLGSMADAVQPNGM